MVNQEKKLEERKGTLFVAVRPLRDIKTVTTNRFTTFPFKMLFEDTQFKSTELEPCDSCNW